MLLYAHEEKTQEAGASVPAVKYAQAVAMGRGRLGCWTGLL